MSRGQMPPARGRLAGRPEQLEPLQNDIVVLCHVDALRGEELDVRPPPVREAAVALALRPRELLVDVAEPADLDAGRPDDAERRSGPVEDDAQVALGWERLVRLVRRAQARRGPLWARRVPGGRARSPSRDRSRSPRRCARRRSPSPPRTRPRTRRRGLPSGPRACSRSGARRGARGRPRSGGSAHGRRRARVGARPPRAAPRRAEAPRAGRPPRAAGRVRRSIGRRRRPNWHSAARPSGQPPRVRGTACRRRTRTPPPPGRRARASLRRGPRAARGRRSRRGRARRLRGAAEAPGRAPPRRRRAPPPRRAPPRRARRGGRRPSR